jgi:hypothetical protein
VHPRCSISNVIHHVILVAKKTSTNTRAFTFRIVQSHVTTTYPKATMLNIKFNALGPKPNGLAINPMS